MHVTNVHTTYHTFKMMVLFKYFYSYWWNAFWRVHSCYCPVLPTFSEGKVVHHVMKTCGQMLVYRTHSYLPSALGGGLPSG